MRPTTIVLAGVFLAFLAFLAAGARADDIDLRTGRTISGKIVKEDDASVTIEWRGGTMTIERTQIKEVRRSPPPAEPAPAPAPSATGKSGTRKGADNPPSRDPASKTPKAGKTLADRVTEIEAIRLVPWPEDPSLHCSEPDAKHYKIVRVDGSTAMKDDRPASPSGIEALYVRNDASYGQMIEYMNGERRMYWYRLYWNEATKEWGVNHPNLEAFQMDSALSRVVADAVCSDENARIAAFCDVQGIKYGLQGSTSYDAAKEHAKLLEDCRKAMGSDAGGQALADYHDCVVRTECAPTPADKIRGAMERRAILRRLVAATLVK